MKNKFNLKGLYNLLSLKSPEELIRAKMDANIPVFLHGKPGVGKSQRVAQIDPDLETLELSLTPIEELTGFTVADDNGVVKKIMPEWLKRLIDKCNEEPDKNHILFLDELTNAAPLIQTLAYSLILDRKVANTWELPKNVRIVSAGNEVNDSIVAEEMPEPLKNRMAHIEIDSNAGDWLDWAYNNKINTKVWSFIISHPDALCGTFEDENGDSRYVSPRTWERVSKALDNNVSISNLNSILPHRVLIDFIDSQYIQSSNEEKLTNIDKITELINADIPVFLHGGPGEGKSQRVLQIDPDATVLELSMLPIEDLTGTMVYDGTTAKRIMPEWLKELNKKCEEEPNKKHVLFLDELTNAVPSIQQLAYSLVLNKKVANMWNLPENACIVAAGNETKDSIVAEEMPLPLKDRFAHLNIKTSIDEWIDWAIDAGIEPSIISFVAMCPDTFLRNENTKDKLVGRITPRTWEKASRLISSCQSIDNLEVCIGETLKEKFENFYDIKVPTDEEIKSPNFANYNYSVPFTFIPMFLNGRPELYGNYIQMLKHLRDGEYASRLFARLWKKHRKEVPQDFDIQEHELLVSEKDIPEEFIVTPITRSILSWYMDDYDDASEYEVIPYYDIDEFYGPPLIEQLGEVLQDEWDKTSGTKKHDAVIRNSGTKSAAKTPRKYYKKERYEYHRF